MKKLIMIDYDENEINLTEEFDLEKNWDIITNGTMNNLEIVEQYLEYQDLTILDIQEFCENWWNSEGFNVDTLKMVDIAKSDLKGKKVKELTVEERKYLESIISGDYRMDDNGKEKEGRTEVTIDFENGLSVGGWFVFTENERYYELDDDAIIYDPCEQ